MTECGSYTGSYRSEEKAGHCLGCLQNCTRFRNDYRSKNDLNVWMVIEATTTPSILCFLTTTVRSARLRSRLVPKTVHPSLPF
jgi:hypothetical protein